MREEPLGLEKYVKERNHLIVGMNQLLQFYFAVVSTFKKKLC